MLFPLTFEQSVARTPDRSAVVHLNDDTELTYSELQSGAYRVANALRDRGLESGDRVAICMANSPEHVVAFVATQLAGVVAVPFNFRVAASGVRYHVEDSDPELLLFDELSRDAVTAIAEEIDVPMVHAGADTPEFAESFEEFADAPAVDPDVEVDYRDPSVMLYSSGTTGDPKGIPLDHEATASRWLINALGQHYYLDENMLGVMPLYHTVGLHGILCGLLSMSGTYLCMSDFDPDLAVRGIEEYNVSALHEAPTIFASLLDSDAIDEVDLSSVQTIGYSGAPMSQSVFDRTMEAFDPDHIANLYGTTEAYGTLAHVELHDINDPTVSGPANVGMTTRIVDFDSEGPEDTVETGTQGELIVKTNSPVTFNGYWNKPKATEKRIHDGWFFTGDAARRTEENRIIITGRVDDMIISGGENIYPSEVEDVLLTHPDVADAGVVGHPNEKWGEMVVAFVERSDSVTEAELDEWCRDSDELADYKRPRQYHFVDGLPRNPSGKIERYKLESRTEE
jgi:long-chain acyl-CoA synthetase